MLETFEPSAEFKLDRILAVLEKLHDTKVNFDVAPAELVDVYKHYDQIKEGILQKQQFNTYHTNKEYTKACLIQESIKIFLTEIAPARRRGKARSK